MTQQQLQWLEEDLCPEPRLLTLPSYHSWAMSEVSDHPSIPALDLVLDHKDREEMHTPAPNSPLPEVHLSVGWHCNINKETGNPIFTKYLIDNNLKIIAPYFQFDMDSDSPKLLLTRGHHCSVHSCTLRAHKDPYPRPALTCKQHYSFDADQPFSHLVDWAME